MKKFQTPYLNHVRDLEKNTLPSMTQPDQAMSVSEIKARFQSGRPVSRNENMLYSGNVYIPNIARMDLTEQTELKNAMQENINKIRNEANELKKKQEELLEQERNEYLKFRDEWRESQKTSSGQVDSSTIQS